MTLPAEASFLALDLKSVTAEGAFEGYASLFNREDLGRDVILPGAFTETLQKRPAGGVRLLFQHDPAEPIGVWEHLQEDARGLFGGLFVRPGHVADPVVAEIPGVNVVGLVPDGRDIAAGRLHGLDRVGSRTEFVPQSTAA